MTKHLLIFLALTLQFSVSKAQCTDETLCAEDGPTMTTLDAPSPLQYECLDVEYSYVYSFTTNADAASSSATISIENINCGDSTPADSIQALVIQPNAGMPCNFSAATTISSCQSDSVSMSLSVDNLAPSTDYYVLVGSDVPGCGFATSITGDAVSINVCCNTDVVLGFSYTVEELSGSDDYTWSPLSYIEDPDSSNPTITPEQSVEYTVTADIGECTATDQLFINVTAPVEPPNMFTPNGDFVNDLWLIEGIDRFEAATVTVFDRWGQVVFKSIGYVQPWDGTNRGKELPSATYYYVIEINSRVVDSEPITGSITIVK